MKQIKVHNISSPTFFPHPQTLINRRFYRSISELPLGAHVLKIHSKIDSSQAHKCIKTGTESCQTGPPVSSCCLLSADYILNNPTLPTVFQIFPDACNSGNIKGLISKLYRINISQKDSGSVWSYQ